MLRLLRNKFCRFKDQVGQLFDSFNSEVTSGNSPISTFNKYISKIQALSPDRKQMLYCQVAFKYPELSNIILKQGQTQGEAFKKVAFAIKSNQIQTGEAVNLPLYQECKDIASSIDKTDSNYYQRQSILQMIMYKAYDSVQPTPQILNLKLQHARDSIRYGILDLHSLLESSSFSSELQDSTIMAITNRLRIIFEIATETIQLAVYLDQPQPPFQIIMLMSNIIELCQDKNIETSTVPFCFTYMNCVVVYLFQHNDSIGVDVMEMGKDIKEVAYDALNNEEGEYQEVKSEAAVCYLTINILEDVKNNKVGIRERAKGVIEEIMVILRQWEKDKNSGLKERLENFVEDFVVVKEDGTEDIVGYDDGKAEKEQ